LAVVARAPRRRAHAGLSRRRAPRRRLVCAEEKTHHLTMAREKFKEPQYEGLVELRDREGAALGLMSNFTWHDDPKRLLFVLSRYKFAAKMLSGLGRVLEIGCADAFGTRIVVQETGAVTAVDFDPVLIKDVAARMDPHWKFEARVHDILKGPVSGGFDAAYALDVLEHIPKKDEAAFFENACRSLNEHGVLLIGTPSLESQAYASPRSKEGHVNCKDSRQLKAAVSRYFHNVFMFSMNDEVVHTGYPKMAHYLFALGCARKKSA
jgi:SAM-dependent methyltransferase